MKRRFDSNQEDQLEAIKSIADNFEGQQKNRGEFEFSFTEQDSIFIENGFGIRIGITYIKRQIEFRKRYLEELKNIVYKRISSVSELIN